MRIKREMICTNPESLAFRKRFQSWSPEKQASFRAKSKEYQRIQRAKLSPEKKQEQLRKNKQYREQKKLRPSLGLCAGGLNCKEPLIGKSMYCEEHWLFNVVKDQSWRWDWGKNGIVFEELKELWKKQNGFCAVSGVKIIPGSTASLDHIHPVSKDGIHEISNLRFVHKIVNRMKGPDSDEEIAQFLRFAGPGLLRWAFAHVRP